VAASLQTPTLFLIATDLTKMQVDTSVSESDIAGARQGAPASFTVDAFPNQTFQGAVAQVRESPISVQNVITYDVVIAVANPGLLLKPGMTATAAIVKAQALNVVRVPSQALRFTPAGAAKPPAGQRAVWVLRNGKLVRVPVTVGLNDDTNAEIKSGDLQIGDQVVTAVAAVGAASKSKTATAPSLHV
jgi:HlyD family secretion protein